MPVTTIISDFGGVLTTPLMQSFAAFQDHSGIPPEALGKAMQRAADRDGAHPLFELECGRMTEAEFLDGLEADLEHELGHRPELHRFTEIYFDALNPNGPMVELMRELRDSGYRMALLTNNVREWEPLWRSMLPVDEIFEFVVDSGFEGMRKPDAGDLRVDGGAAGRRRRRRAVPVRRRRGGQRRRRPRTWHARSALPRQRAGDRRDPRGARSGPVSGAGLSGPAQLSLPARSQM